MENLSLKDEDIVMKIKVCKPITKGDVINNFIANLLVVGGDIANNINMILTKDSIYFEAKGHVILGYSEETRSIEKISLNDIEEFKVTIKDSEEIINISTRSGELSFIRDN